jgi:hypothetical protein
MRPSSQGLVPFVSNVFARKDTYYYRADIPTDLQRNFPTTEAKQSLKTKGLKVAKCLATGLGYPPEQGMKLFRLRQHRSPQPVGQRWITRSRSSHSINDKALRKPKR